MPAPLPAVSLQLRGPARIQEPITTPEPPCDAAWQVIEEIEETLAFMRIELRWTNAEEQTIRQQVCQIIGVVPIRD